MIASLRNINQKFYALCVFVRDNDFVLAIQIYYQCQIFVLKATLYDSFTGHKTEPLLSTKLYNTHCTMNVIYVVVMDILEHSGM